MIWKRLFPTEGGGALRRWMKVRKDIFEMHITKKSQTKNSDAMKSFERVHYPPLTIFDFTRKDDAADANLIHHGPTKGGWRYSDDEVIGGYSRGTLQLISKEQSDDNHDDTNTNDKIPYLHWEGTIDTTIGPTSRAQRSGFCAIRCPEFPFGGVPIGFRYNALEIICRTDGRIYTVNLKVGSYFEDDLYQGVIKINPASEADNEFVTLVLPFRDFVLTSSGLIREQQRDLDGAIQLEHFGLTLMDGVDGPFQFDLARVRAVNYMNGEILGESNDEDDEDDEDTVGEDESGRDGGTHTKHERTDSDDERDGPVDTEEERKPDRT